MLGCDSSGFMANTPPNNMPPTPGSSRRQQQYSFVSNPHAMRPRPGPYFSGNPYMAHPQATHQPSTAGYHQQYGSGMPVPSQEQFAPMTSAGHGHGAFSTHYAMAPSSQAQPLTPQAAIPQQIDQHSAIPQGTFSLPANPQAAISQQITQQQAFSHAQANFPQTGFPQANPQAAISQQITQQQAFSHAQAYFPQTDFPQTAIPQAAVSLPANPQQIIQQPGFSQPATAQAYFPQTDFPQAANPQAALPRTAYPEATVPQTATPPEAIPQQITQQPPYQAQAQHQLLAQNQPQAPPLTFEQRIAAFKPVPDPKPEPTRRPGPGRRKKDQRFWAPQDANKDLRRRYEMLQAADNRVDIAKKKLLKNDKPSQIVHLQTILLRNMQEREDLWNQCQRLEDSEVAVSLPLPEAEAKTKRLHESWADGCARLQARKASLRTEHPEAVGDDGEIDVKRLGTKDRQGLQTMINWSQHNWFALEDSFATLRHARKLAYGNDVADTGPFTMRTHELGVYEGWSHLLFPGNSLRNIAWRRKFSNPDFSTWITDEVPDLSDVAPHLYQPAQPEVQQQWGGQPEYAQPEYDLSAPLPHINNEPGTSLDQTLSIDPRLLYNQDEQQPQTQEPAVPLFTEEDMADMSGPIDQNGEYQPPPAQEAATNEQMDLSPSSSSFFDDTFFDYNNEWANIDPTLLRGDF